MSMLTGLKSRWSKTSPFKVLPRGQWAGQRPTYQDAQPAIIDAALDRSQRRPSGNWYAFAASDAIRKRPLGTSVGGLEIVAWRGADGTLHVGPGTCPHLGADLSTGTVDCGALICPWHGLRLAGGREFGWKPYPAHDDGVLAWVRLDGVGGEEPTERPIAARPARRPASCTPSRGWSARASRATSSPTGSTRGTAPGITRIRSRSSRCCRRRPTDVDLPEDSDRFLVPVTFHIGRFGVPVVAEFTSPEPRTIVMRIVDGEGAGSVVETHATPVGPGPDGLPRTAVIEAVVAHSDRPGFVHALRGRPLIAPFMRQAATRLWRDDLAYAERRYLVRTRG